MADDDTPYLLRGITQIPTESSVLVSSSRYLNSAAMREWVAQELLRKNGPDLPTPSGAFRLAGIVKEIQDWDRIEELFARERQVWPELDRFFDERFISTFTREDLQEYPPESVAGIFYKILTEGNYQVNIVPPYEPKNQYEYWLLRSGQTHDLEHIITHGTFDSVGEVSTAFARLENTHRWFSPDLAGELTAMGFFGAFRFLTRTVLHYPHVWHDMFGAMERGRRVGRASAPYIMAKYEDVFHLTPAEARKVLGVHEVEEVDTAAPSRIWDAREAPPTDMIPPGRAETATG